MKTLTTIQLRHLFPVNRPVHCEQKYINEYTHFSLIKCQINLECQIFKIYEHFHVDEIIITRFTMSESQYGLLRSVYRIYLNFIHSRKLFILGRIIIYM